MMRAMADTVGMKPAERVAYWLEGITRHCHRGPRRDTWTSARDRAAKLAGIEPTIAKRIWQRWRYTHDFASDVALRLAAAYEKVCLASEAEADRLHNERMALRGLNAAVGEEPAQAGGREGAAGV